jgi:DNA-binding NarL/FixJ family response regulator
MKHERKRSEQNPSTESTSMPTAANQAAKHSDPNQPVQLNPRQLEIARLVADGLSGQQIASQLGISPKTVEFHRNNVYRTVGVKNAVQLVRYLIRDCLLEP